MSAISWPLLLWSGLVGLVFSTWLLMALRKLGATRYLPRAYWACALFRGTGNAALVFGGLVRMAAMVAAFPIAYAIIFAAAGQAEILVGLIAGAAHGLLAGAFLPFAARRCPGAIAPGPLGWNLGRPTPLVLLLTHGVYGAALGYVYVLPA